MTEEITIEIDEEALDAVPVFPLPGTVLLPHTLVSLHIFEPRYRQMMAYCLENHRVMALAMLDEGGEPDAFGRPPVHRVAGLGYVRRSARLPDGRYNLVLEGVARVDVSDEHAPETAFRRARALLLEDHVGDDPAALVTAAHAVRALASRALDGDEDRELLGGLHALEPGPLADAIAASLLEDARERQRVLEAVDVRARLELVSGILGARLIETADEARPPPARDDETRLPSWGIVPGKA